MVRSSFSIEAKLRCTEAIFFSHRSEAEGFVPLRSETEGFNWGGNKLNEAKTHSKTVTN
jgi:hypothetical protein